MSSKLELTAQYIRQMYSEGEEFRYDLLSRKTQIMQEDLSWRNVTDKDINTIACNCAQATGASISDKEVRMRVASFCASGNNKEFLTDDTGNRRWLPFEVESIQNPFYTTLPYELMYAEAVWLIKQGYNYWFSMEDIEKLEEHNEEYRTKRNEEELLTVYFEPCEPTANKAVFMTASEIHAKLKMWGNIERPMGLNKFGELLRAAGYERKCLHNGKKGYVVKVTENLSDKQYNDIREVMGADRADSKI